MWKHQRDELTKLAAARGVTFGIIDGDTPDWRVRGLAGAFQEGELQTMFLHPATGAHGLTLTRANTVIWASPTYEPDLKKQGDHRIRRIRQTQKTDTLLVCARNTIDEHVYRVMDDKNVRMNNLLEILRGDQV